MPSIINKTNYKLCVPSRTMFKTHLTLTQVYDNKTDAMEY